MELPKVKQPEINPYEDLKRYRAGDPIAFKLFQCDHVGMKMTWKKAEGTIVSIPDPEPVEHLKIKSGSKTWSVILADIIDHKSHVDQIQGTLF